MCTSCHLPTEVEWNTACQGGWVKSWLCCFLRCDPHLVRGITAQSLVSGPELPQPSPHSFIRWPCLSATWFSHLQGERDNGTSSGAVVRVECLITRSAPGAGLDAGQAPCHWWRVSALGLAAPSAWKALPHWACSLIPPGLCSSAPFQGDLTWLCY